MKPGTRIGIDLGGTKTEIIALSADGKELLRNRRPTPSQSYEAIIENLRLMVSEVDNELGVKASVGVGIPGAISPATKLVKNANTTCLIGKPFDRDLEKALNRPVRLANDANCFALSEAVDGAGQGADVVFGVILGTGVGGGVVVRGQILNGPNSIAGEWGHNPLPWPQDSERPGAQCYCGKLGCIETFLAGPSLRRDHLLRWQEDLSTADIHQHAQAGDEKAEATLQIYEDRLARALATVVNLLDPDRIVLGGGLSNLDRLYQNLPKLLARYAFSDELSTQIVPAKFGDSSGVRGAAWLW